MSHDRLRAAVRRRMAETGEPYAVSRRRVIEDHRAAAPENLRPAAQWFAISYSNAGIDKITAWLDTVLFRTGPGVAGVQVTAGQLLIRMGDYRLTVLRASVVAARRSSARLRGTTGIHQSKGRLLINGSASGLVELTLSPPARTGRTWNTGFVNQRVDSLILSLVDPDGFLAAVAADATGPPL